MRFSTIIVGAFAAVAAAADSSSSVTTPTPSVAAPSTSVSLDPAQATIVNCLKGCDPADVNCRAKCLNVPYPNEGQVNATTACVAKCPKGSGNDADINAYGTCVQACIGQNYWTSAGGTPQPTGASGSGSGSGSSSASGSSPSATGSSGSGSSSSSASGSSTASGSGASASQTNAPKNPADSLRVGTSAVALVGFLAAFVLL